VETAGANDLERKNLSGHKITKIMGTKVSLSAGLNRPAPKAWRNFERGMLLLIIPAVTVILQSWGFQDEKLALKLNLLINTGVVAIIKFVGMCLVDDQDAYVSNLSEEQQDKVNIPPVGK
jgi:hypothetical protein